MQPARLLIVDDDQGDRFLLKRAFEKLNVGYRIHALENGGRALALIKGEGEFADRKADHWPSDERCASRD